MIAEKASVLLCYQHYSFNFDGIYLKLADKVDMDDISNRFETWTGRIINLRITFS